MLTNPSHTITFMIAEYYGIKHLRSIYMVAQKVSHCQESSLNRIKNHHDYEARSFISFEYKMSKRLF